MRTRLTSNRRPGRPPAGNRDRTLGQSLVEFGLVLPVLMLIFAAAADFGRIFYGYVALENAVKEGALYGARYPLCADSSTLCPDPDNVRWRVEEEAATVRNPNGSKLTPTSQCLSATTGTAYSDLRDCVAGDTYVVAASYRLNLITPILGSVMGDGFTLTSRATAVVLNQAFDPTPGVGVTKLVRAAEARNRDDIRAKCVEPDPTGSPDYYRAPCIDKTVEGDTTFVTATFRTGDTIAYKVIVRNTGGTNVTSVTMSDTFGWPGGCAAPGSLPVNGPAWQCTYTRSAPSIAGSATTTSYANTFTVDGAEIEATTDVAAVTIEKPPPDLRVLKYASPYQAGADGDGSISGTATFGTTQSLTVSRTSGSVSVWYKVIVTNNGGQAATGVQISDSFGTLPYGQNNSTAVCDPAPSTLGVGGRFECRYRRTFTSDGAFVNTVLATATGVSTDADDDNDATVTVAPCGGSNRVVPNLIGLTKAAAQTAWTTAGFTGALSTWSGSNSATTVAQSQQAYACLVPGTTITISRTNT